VHVELIGRLSSGDELRIWESNRYDASPQQASVPLCGTRLMER